MGRRKRELPVLTNIEITGVGAEGNSIARHDDKVVFIPYGAPGDIVNVKIDKKRHSFSQGHITDIVSPSPLRITPRCNHFGICGGCKWQHVPYSFQLQFKRQQVIDALQRIAKVPFPEIPECLGSDNEWEYRNKVEYTFSNKKWLTFEQIESGEAVEDREGAGFHIPGAFDKVLDIDRCHLHDQFGNDLRDFIKKTGKERGWDFYDLRNQTGFLRTLMVRTFTTGEKLAVIVVGEDDNDKIRLLMDAIKDEFPDINSLSYVVNRKVNDSIADQNVVTYYGRNYAEEKLGGLTFRISPKSFYQTNSRQANRLYSVVAELAGPMEYKLVYDLYTGTGTIANFIAGKSGRVIGIEYVEDAIADASLNAMINGIDNTEFYAGDMKDVLTADFIKKKGHPDVMIIDPPRAGMHKSVIEVILQTLPPRIVYVSCNPATQARDIADLSEKYDITAVQPVDMFPHTHHVENVVRLDLRETGQV